MRLGRLLRIIVVALRHGLDELALGHPRLRPLRLFVHYALFWRDLSAPRGERLRRALEDLGPIVGQRVADAGRAALTFPEYAATRVAANVGTYARDEAQVLAHPADMRALVDDTAVLAARIDALEARVQSLAERLQPPLA